MHRRAELFYQQLDGLLVLRNTVPGELLAESRKHQAVKILRQVPSIGPLRAALLLALMQTPHRFRSKRQLWTYSGLAVVTHDSAQHRYVDGQLQRSKKPQQIRGLNQNHNHAMKEIFKSAALNASRCAGPLQDFNARLLAKGMKAGYGSPNAGTQDRRHHVSSLEKRREFRRRTSEIASSLSVYRNPGN